MSAARLAAIVSLALLAGFALACRTTSIPAPQTLPVPPGLSRDRVRTAIILAVSHDSSHSVALWVLPWGGMSGEIRQQRLGGQWYPEREVPGRIYAIYRTNQHRLRVAIYYSPLSVVVVIVDSQNLRQSETRIHKAAILWVGHLVEHIRISLGRVAVQPST